jgi:hypothetical protein
MKATKLPLLTMSSSPPAREQSAKNLDALFSAVVLFLNLHPVDKYTNDLIGILSAMHNNFTMKLSHDPKEAIKLYKSLSLYYVDFVRGIKHNNVNNSFNAYEWDVASDVPLLFVALIPFIENLINTGVVAKTNLWTFHQAIYCFLSGHRVIVTPMEISVGTITKESTVASIPNYTNEIPNALKRLGITSEEFMKVYNAECASAKLAVVTSAGPNGQATWSAHEDSIAVQEDTTLLQSMRDFAHKSDLLWIIKALLGCGKAPKALSGAKDGAFINGRIHPIEEWGGKTRLVAILDYWTQALLTPLHNTIAHFLRTLPQDGTFDQLSIISKVKAWTGDKSKSVYSYDLTAATDRLPISFQREILLHLFGSESMADAWVRIMSHRDFRLPNGTSVRYAVGQPMGAKSSFPMLGLTHHVIVQLAAIQAQVNDYGEYVILGDDNTQTDPKVADRYTDIMNKLGVTINLSKSMTPGNQLASAGEICKRIFIEGSELTALPAKLIVKCTRFGHLLPALQNTLFERGRPIGDSHLINFFAGLVDNRSLITIQILNKVPLSVSGLSYKVDVSDKLDYSQWHKNLILKDDIIEHAFMYALVTEQLKRVDGLLRGTIQMNEIIVGLAKSRGEFKWPPGFYLGLTDAQREDLSKKLPVINIDHPMVYAAHDEFLRVVSYLSALRAGTPEMVSAARKGLLDLLRNSLHEIWLGDSARASTVQRSVFNVMLQYISRMQDIAAKKDEKRPTVLNFSVLLSAVGRMWSVTWKFGDPIFINVVKSKVDSTVTGVKLKVDKSLENVDFSNLRI